MTDVGAKVLGVYCERGLDPSFWAEPVNAVSNLGFIVAGVVALARFRGDRAVTLLAVVTLAIGIGSFLFHSFATRWALIADVAPIQAFIAIYFYLAMSRFLGMPAWGALAATLAFMGAASALPAILPPAEPWRGLGGYLGGFLGLVGVGGLLLARSGPSAATGRAILGVAALFLVSLTFRTLDRFVCEGLPTGTHAAWHLLNALVLFTLMAILGRTPPRIRPNPDVG